jgi:hypothetical protein
MKLLGTNTALAFYCMLCVRLTARAFGTSEFYTSEFPFLPVFSAVEIAVADCWMSSLSCGLSHVLICVRTFGVRCP